MNNKFSKIIRTVVFLLLVAIILSLFTMIYKRKSYVPPFNYMAKFNEFYNLPENSLDYIVFGASHAYCTINPLETKEAGGGYGFVLATQEQPSAATYYYIKEALKTQSPKYIVYECYMSTLSITPSDSALCCTFDSLRPSLNKVELIKELTSKDTFLDYLLNLPIYHSRWKELEADDIKLAFSEPEDTYKGYVPATGKITTKNAIPDYSKYDSYIAPEKLEDLDRILKLCKDNNAELVLLISASDIFDHIISGFKAEMEWAEKNGVKVIDILSNMDNIGIDPLCDYYDASHFDVSGSKKASIYFAEKLCEFGFTPTVKNEIEEKYENDYALYAKEFENELK